MATLKFNIADNTIIPTIYDKFNIFKVREKDGNIVEKTLEPLFGIVNEYINFLQVGKKYYTIINSQAIAFKVEQIIFGVGSKYDRGGTMYKILLANGETDYWKASTICASQGEFKSVGYHSVFETIGDLNKFISTYDFSLLYHPRILIHELLLMYTNEFREKLVDTSYIGKVGYYIDYDLSVKALYFGFKYMWIDKSGLHYELYPHNTNKTYGLHELFENYKDCLNSRQVIDFDDDEEEENDDYVDFNVHIKVLSKGKDFFLNEMIKKGAIQTNTNELVWHIEE